MAKLLISLLHFSDGLKTPRLLIAIFHMPNFSDVPLCFSDRNVEEIQTDWAGALSYPLPDSFQMII